MKSKIIKLILILLLVFTTQVSAHGGNITGWKDKNSEKIVEYNGKYYGYHNQDGKRHYHEVQWNETEKRWNILKSAVCYDENFNVIQNIDNGTEKIEVKLVSSIDGDTAKFQMNGETVTVRFLGIDTPESVHPTKEVEAFGIEASNFTKEKLQSANKIELEFDEKAGKTDKYNRYLAWVFVDGELLQEKIVASGFAKTYMLQDNYKYAGVLQQSEEIAKNAKLNIWSNENTTTETSNTEVQENNNEEVMQNNNSSVQIDYETITLCIAIISAICVIVKGILKKNKKRKGR